LCKLEVFGLFFLVGVMVGEEVVDNDEVLFKMLDSILTG
jgi:hypothetical protein